MTRPARLAFSIAVCLLLPASRAFADAFDGMVMMAVKGPGTGVTLNWTGGQPTFSVYRSTSAAHTLDPSSLIGTTDVRTFGDTPPPGAIFFYEIKSPCVYNPPEICNGIDDDCDGTIDGPGSESSCHLANAVPVCVGGSCAISACNSGYGDCDGAASDGCESNLMTDSGHCGSCTLDCDASLDVCTHSACSFGSCGAPFDRSRCLAPRGDTTTAGACAFAAAGCTTAVDSDGDGLNDTWEDNGGIDIDCNGILDSNDVALPGADKRVKDVYVHIDWMAPSTHLYPSQDASVPGCPITSVGEPSGGHKPQQDSIDLVVRAFAGAHLAPEPLPCGKNGDPPCPSGTSCVDFVCLPLCSTDADCTQSCNADCQQLGGAKCIPQGAVGSGVCRLWRLHVDPLPATGVPHHDIVTYGPESASCANPAGGGSGTPGDQVNFFDLKSGGSFDPKKSSFYHYLVFAHDNTCYGTGSPGCGDSSCAPTGDTQPKPNTTGIAEIYGNDMIVSLGLTQAVSTDHDTVVRNEAGTIMHELGHNMGLHHGGSVGPPNPPPKPNYLSAMNYMYQLPGIPVTDTPGSVIQTGTRIDFSHQSLTTVLNESSLSEPVGIGGAGLQDPSKKWLIRYSHPQTPVCPCPIDPCTGLPTPTCTALASGTAVGTSVPPIDWNCDGFISPFPVAADINGNGIPGEIQDPSGTNDWMSLFFPYQCQASYADGATGPTEQGAPTTTPLPAPGTAQPNRSSGRRRHASGRATPHEAAARRRGGRGD
jgi:hypothetical protein